MGSHSLKVPRAGGGLRALGGRRLQREGETETEEEKQRWAEMGRMARRQTAGEFKKKLKKKKREESTRFSGGCDTQIPKSKQQMKKQREVEQMKG